MSFTYHYWACMRRKSSAALEADRSDPKLWLLYGFALKSAGREDQALSIMNDAYDGYVRTGNLRRYREALPTYGKFAPRGERPTLGDIEEGSKLTDMPLLAGG
jgi:hypothetical protein